MDARKLILHAERLGVIGGIPANFWTVDDLARQKTALRVLEEASKRRTKADLALLDKFPLPRRKGSRPTVLSRACAMLARWKRRPPVGLDEVTIGITTWKRKDSLKRCKASIRKYFPRLRVIVQDTGGNLSKGRNEFFKKVETPFAFMIEDDMELTDDSDIWSLLEILKHDESLVMAAGWMHQRNPKSHNWGHDFFIAGGKLHARPTNRPLQQTNYGTPYQPCELVCNYGMYRTELARRFPWYEELPLGEHRAWFHSFRGQHLVALTNRCSVIHYSDRPNKEYNDRRSRASTYWPLAEKLMGILLGKVTGGYQFSQGKLPNVVVLTVGHTNSSLTVAQLGQLGWNLNGAGPNFWELPELNRINDEYLSKPGEQRQFDYKAAWDFVAGLERPWVLKDPRMCHTMRMWDRVLFDHQPHLLFLEKDEEQVRRSWDKYDGGSTKLGVRLEEAEKIYDKWVFPKMRLQAEDLAHAFNLFDPKRMEYCL